MRRAREAVDGRARRRAESFEDTKVRMNVVQAASSCVRGCVRVCVCGYHALAFMLAIDTTTAPLT